MVKGVLKYEKVPTAELIVIRDALKPLTESDPVARMIHHDILDELAYREQLAREGDAPRGGPLDSFKGLFS